MSSNTHLRNKKCNHNTVSVARNCFCEGHAGLKGWYLNLHFINCVQDPAHSAVPSTNEHAGRVTGKESTELQGFDRRGFSYIKNLEMKEKENLFVSYTILHL